MAQEWEGAGGSAYDGAGSKARTVVVIKRSLSPGFAAISNPLLAADKTIMLLDDGRAMVQTVLKVLKEG
jgi:H+-translocating NAD(P) transhydrogenase subunit beta